MIKKEEVFMMQRHKKENKKSVFERPRNKRGNTFLTVLFSIFLVMGIGALGLGAMEIFGVTDIIKQDVTQPTILKEGCDDGASLNLKGRTLTLNVYGKDRANANTDTKVALPAYVYV